MAHMEAKKRRPFDLLNVDGLLDEDDDGSQGPPIAREYEEAFLKALSPERVHDLIDCWYERAMLGDIRAATMLLSKCGKLIPDKAEVDALARKTMQGTTVEMDREKLEKVKNRGLKKKS